MFNSPRKILFLWVQNDSPAGYCARLERELILYVWYIIFCKNHIFLK